MGSRLFSNTTNLLGGRDFQNADHRRHVAQILEIDPRCIPDRPSWAYDQIIEGILQEKIKGLWVIATNPAHSWINQHMLRDVLSRLDFLVVQDMYATTETVRQAQPQWVTVGHVSDFPVEGGAAFKYGQVQIAVFHFTSREAWYACQNMCPHKRAFVLSRGIIGSQGDVPKVACPLHKKTFSLESGECLSGDELSVKVFPVKIVVAVGMGIGKASVYK